VSKGGGGGPWYKTSAFAQVMLVIVVFFFTWLALAAIRPGFTRVTPVDRNSEEEKKALCSSFSSAKGAAYAAGAAVLCAIGMLVLAIVPLGKSR
jgi:hypothetical protein